MPRPARRGGFTLIELMLAVVIMAIVVSQVFLMISTQKTYMTGHERVVSAQNDARLVADMVVADVMAGGFLVPQIAGLSSLDGGAAGSDVLCVSDSSGFDDVAVDDATARFAGASLTGNLNNNADSVSLSLASMDIDGDGDVDFGAGQGIIVSDGSDTHCALITSIFGGNTVNFLPPTPNGFSVTAGAGRVVPALIYQVTAAGLTRNAVMLSTQIENLQIEFGVDNDADGLIEPDAPDNEFPIHSLGILDPSRIRLVRISVIARTASQDPNIAGAAIPAAGNFAGGPADGFLRRRYTSTVVPRNLL